MKAIKRSMPRHRWGEAIRDLYSTERRCRKCQMRKITHHEGGGIPWIEFLRGNQRVSVDVTPLCEVVS